MKSIIESGANGDVTKFNVIRPWIWFTGMSGLFGFVASSMTTYWA